MAKAKHQWAVVDNLERELVDAEGRLHIYYAKTKAVKVCQEIGAHDVKKIFIVQSQRLSDLIPQRANFRRP